MRNSIIIELAACLFVISSAVDKCGIPKVKPRFYNYTNNYEDIGQIVGGSGAVPHSYPWMIKLLIIIMY